MMRPKSPRPNARGVALHSAMLAGYPRCPSRQSTASASPSDVSAALAAASEAWPHVVSPPAPARLSRRNKAYKKKKKKKKDQKDAHMRLAAFIFISLRFEHG
jgi:hypothetical protein